MTWDERDGAGWSIGCSAGEVSSVLQLINDRLADRPTMSSESLPREWLSQAAHMLQTYPEEYKSRVARTYCSVESLRKCDERDLLKVGLTRHSVDSATEEELRLWTSLLHKRVRFLSIKIEFRCDSQPFAYGGCRSDHGLVVDPWSRVWEVGNCGEDGYIEGWFEFHEQE
jgi:hypothetical protein